ncbi:MAG: chromosome segregation protein SMC [Clostridiales bacterium]|nr:chromosome segregation protein SMC [Clostridiales bacterium]
MYLKKLELQGFKSFPEYTCIEFDKGLTAVVGPNGSGKSNVTDAVRWVLGEQSVKQLRGGKMEDVIFNGTSSRKPMNYAEVTITFDNADKYVDYDFPEICITRRLYRSGESEYQINKVNCRLKDITGLFLDTGLGKDGYSIVGQGRVDEILSNKSEDRRRVMEEASGIVKYKVRKEEAERKLNSTEQNLLRINDILGELEERKGPLEEQAGKAKQYNAAYEEMKALETALLVHRIKEAEKAMGDSASLKETLEAEIKEQQDKYMELREINKAVIARSEELDEKIEDERQTLSDLTEKEHELITEKKVSAERLKQTEEQLSEYESDKSVMQERIAQLESDLKEKNEYAAKLLQEANDAREESEKIAAEKEASQKQYEEQNKDMDEIGASLKSKTDELYETRRRIDEIKAQISAIDDRIKSLGEERLAAIDAGKQLEEGLKEADARWHDMKVKTKEVLSDIEVRNKKLETLHGKQVELNQFFDKYNRELSADEARLKTLKDLERRKEGYQESVRRLSEEAEANRHVKGLMVGILGDLIESDAKYEIAIETALGTAIHNVVTKSEADAAELIDVLKTKHLGRVTFLPIENIKPRPIDDKVQSKASRIKGYIGIASDLVKCDRDLTNIISNLLGRIIVSDNLDNARRIAAETGRTVKVITLEGDSVNPGGSLTGGSLKKSGQGGGILGRQREIEKLNASVKALEEKLSDSEEQRQEIDDEIGTLDRELAQLGEQLKFFQLEEVKAEGDYRNTETRAAENKKAIEKCEQDSLDISGNKLRMTGDMEELEAIEKEIESDLAEFEDSVAEIEARSKEFAEKTKELTDKLAAAVALSERKITERNGCIDLAEHIKGQIDEVKASIKNGEAEAKEITKRAGEINKEIAVCEREIENTCALEKVSEEKIAKLNEERSKLSAEMATFGDRLAQVNSLINGLEQKLNAHVSKYDKYIYEIDNDKNKLWEDYSVTYDNIKDGVAPVEKPGEQSKRIATLKNTIRNLGTVNLNALEEYRELSERLDFMTGQRDDIEAAKKDLENVISDLTESMKKEFTEHFTTINENFKKVFTDLFGGGTAEIILDDETDVLGCNIDIKAQPPGKKLQTLSLLSGGERCLTAIGLLFAILELRPSPFVILDEVEAALDDVNISRFTDFVRRHSDRSQFILVTHRKGTMEACDQMYGVTMAERGVSKILSMELK